MLNSKSHIALVLGATALFTSRANAHGYMTKPLSVNIAGNDISKYPAVINSSALGWKGPFNRSPTDNTNNFWIGMNASEYKSIKELVTKVAVIDTPDATIECGSTDPNATPQPLPEMIEWSHSDNEGFTSSHEGGCEAYCDKTMVFRDDNCAKHFTAAPALLPYDKAACEGASRLTFYWMGLHTELWQVYISCAPLEGGSSSSNVTSKSETSTNVKTPTLSADTPAPAADTPTPAPPVNFSTPAPPANAPPPSTTLPVESNNAKNNAKCVRHRRTRD